MQSFVKNSVLPKNKLLKRNQKLNRLSGRCDLHKKLDRHRSHVLRNAEARLCSHSVSINQPLLAKMMSVLLTV